MKDFKTKYLEICETDASIALHGQPWWLDAISGVNNWHVGGLSNDDGSLKLAIPYYMTRLKGFKAIVQPPLSQYSYVWSKSTPRQPLTRCILTESLPRVPIIEINIAASSNIQDHTHKEKRDSYIIKPGSDQDSFRIHYHKNLKRNLKKANETYIVSEEDDPNLFYQTNSASFARQGLSMPYTRTILGKVYDALKHNQSGKILIARKAGDPDQVVGSIMVAWDAEKTYYLAGGQISEKGAPSPHSLLLDTAIQNSLEAGKVFDFCGSMIPGVARFFSSFGGEKVSFSHIEKYRGFGKIRALKKAFF